MKAAVILTKCKQSHELFGIRAEVRENAENPETEEWYATWAFKVSEKTAGREKFGDTEISGNIYITTEYPSCPYCGAKGFFQCSECGKTTCWDGENETVCEWCGNAAETSAEESFEGISGGGF